MFVKSAGLLYQEESKIYTEVSFVNLSMKKKPPFGGLILNHSQIFLQVLL